MNQWTFIIAGPGLDGWFEGPGFLFFGSLALIFVAATLCVLAHEFRLSTNHPPLKRGLIYQIAVWSILSVTCVWMIVWFGLRLFSFFNDR